jgi:hypothetical protein
VAHAIEVPFHPYFDKDLNKQLITTTINGDYANPTISVIPMPGLSLPLTLRVQAQIDTILLRNNIVNWLTKSWTKMTLGPHLWLSLQPGATVVDIGASLQRKFTEMRQHTGTPNDWFSILYHGMDLSPNVKIAILKQLNGASANSIGQIWRPKFPPKS